MRRLPASAVLVVSASWLFVSSAEKARAAEPNGGRRLLPAVKKAVGDYLRSQLAGAGELLRDADFTPYGVTRDGKPLEACSEIRTSRTADLPRVLIIIPAEDGKVPLPDSLFAPERPFLLSLAVVPLAERSGFPPQGSAYNGPENSERHYLWRWIGMEAPDAVVEIVPGKGETWFVPESELPELKTFAAPLPNAKPLTADDGLVAQLVKNSPCNVAPIPAVRVATDSEQWAASLTTALAKAKAMRSPAHAELDRRAARSAKEIVDQLLPHYGKKLDQVAYIPALAVLGRVRQEKIDGGPDAPLSPLVQEAVRPYLDGGKKSWDGKAGGSGLSGHLLFGELATLTGDPRYVKLVLTAANQAFTDDGKPREAMPTHSEMSDAFFMGCPILAQAAHQTGDAKYAEMCLRHMRFMQKLCLREDGLFRHSPLDESAWGRGNGFPALGLSWSLDELSASFAGRDEMVKLHRAHLTALLRHQDASGMWHQVIDHPESYREFTATAMISYALMRGMRNGRLEKQTYAAAVERAWDALKRRIATDGTLVDVCTGTGKMPSLRAYYDRTAILGRDDRGGAMALMVATERELYEAWLAEAAK